MRHSNDLNQDKTVDLTSLGVVDLDISMMPDVFGLRVFVSREPVVRVLPGDFRNLVCVLVPDATAAPIGFHNIIIEDLSGTPDYRARRIVHGDVSSLRRRCIDAVTVSIVMRASSAGEGPGLAPTVACIYYAMFPGISWITTWSSVSSGGVQWSGVPFGRGRCRIAYITCGRVGRFLPSTVLTRVNTG